MWQDYVEADGTAARAIDEHGLFGELDEAACTKIAELLGSLERVLGQAAPERRAKAFWLILADAPKLLDLGVAKPDLVDALRDIGIAAGIPALEADDALARVFSAHKEARQGNGYGQNKKEQTEQSQRYELLAFDDIRLGDEVDYLVKGLLPRKGLAVIYGPPKSGKSFFAFDLLMHVALAWTYRGRKVSQGPVVYFCCEGHAGIPARVEAFRQQFLKDRVEPVPFYVIADRLNLVADHKALIASIKARLGDVKPAAVCLDTLNRSLVGSESKDEDMAKYLSAADALWIEFSCLTVAVHHSGIEKGRPRGHTSLSGAADSQIKTERETDTHNIVATLEWMKDGADGDRIVSQLEVVEVGKDRDGDVITSCVVIEAEESPTRDASGMPMARGAQIALRALEEALSEVGKPAPASNHIPPLVIVCTVDQWRDYAYRMGLSDGEERAQRLAFQRARERLVGGGEVGMWDPYVWLIL